jgi:hypothetical protein
MRGIPKSCSRLVLMTIRAYAWWMPRRFRAPWTVTPTPSGFRVEDATGRALAYVYGEDRSRGVGDAGLTTDEARRIAVNIARLPALLGAQPLGRDRPNRGTAPPMRAD